MTHKEIDRLFDSFEKLRVLIIGDVMIDAYLWGKVNRISPEAPVPVVAVDKMENRLGGAANVALNIQALGAIPLIYSVIGNDDKGNLFMQLLKGQSMLEKGIIQSHDRRTTVKSRILSGGHQMLRIDEENDNNLGAEDESRLIESVCDALYHDNIDAVIFEDYDKGLVTTLLIQTVVEKARTLGISVSVDPKKRNFSAYRNIPLFKPNLKEIREGMKLDIYPDNIAEIENAVETLRAEQEHELVLVTLSELGVYIGGEGTRELIPAHFRDITDVSGAGDTVISVAALCHAVNAPAHVIAALSNLAGGIVCEKVGVAPIDKNQLLEEAKAYLGK